MCLFLISMLYVVSVYSTTQDYQTILENLRIRCIENPQNVAAWTDLGIFYLQHNNIQESFDAHKKALELEPNSANTWFHIANCYLSNDEPEIAEQIYTSILTLSQSQPIVWHNIAYAFKKQNKGFQALEAFEYALRYALEEPGNHLSYALMQLALGNYEVGFAEYEWRWCTALKKIIFDTIPLWNGENLAGKTLLVTAEQGFGDSFQFMRYLKLLHDQGVSIIFRAQGPVMPLAKLCPYISEIIHKDTPPLNKTDAHIPLMSIPYLMGTTVETIPNDFPYLFTNPERDEYWNQKIRGDLGFKIGICFKGNDLFATANFQTTLSKKSFPINLLREFTKIPHTSWFCLQKKSDIPSEISDLSITIFDDSFDVEHGSFVDTASVMKCLDLIITVDTATAHLAGGLGLETIVLLPFAADWRWLINRTDSPWYPTFYLLRQDALNDWTTIVEPLTNKIQELMSKKGYI